ncbi:hypothetical protein JHK87_031581 [Glycine soja]|nr:hypothetical protein JHK87_031581 [Glycine soja]
MINSPSVHRFVASLWPSERELPLHDRHLGGPLPHHPGPASLENRSFCDVGIDVVKKLLVFEVVLLSFFLFSSLVAEGLKLALNLLNNKDADKAFQAHINLRALRLDMVGSAIVFVMGCLFLYDYGHTSKYEDRTSCFFPPTPRVPQMLGLVLRDNGFMDDSEDSFQELSNSSHQRFNILCSADKDGNISLGIFGIFPIRKVNMHNLTFPTSRDGSEMSNRISKASIHKPVVEFIGIRIGELRGLSRWRACYHNLGLDESLIKNATEKADESKAMDSSH